MEAKHPARLLKAAGSFRGMGADRPVAAEAISGFRVVRGWANR